MSIKRLSLAERIRRHENGQSAYPEYIPGVIRSLGEMPTADYLAGLHPAPLRRFWKFIGRPDGGDLTYQQAAKKIKELYGTCPEQAAEAMRILAVPMIRYDEFIRKQEARTHG